MIIWPAGLLTSNDGLHEITAEYPMRDGIPADPYAAPLLTNAYAWIYNPGTISSLPADMYETPVACSEDSLLAMTALSTGKRISEEVSAIIPGIDLGLSGTNIQTLPPSGSIICRASKHLSVTGKPAEMLTSGECNVVTGDISDMKKLCAAGYSTCVTGDYAYTGEPTLCSIIEKDNFADASRMNICEDFITYLTGEGQKTASLSGALPVAPNIIVHTGDPVLSYIEAAIAPLRCITPPYFGAYHVPDPVYDFIDGRKTADESIQTIIQSRRKNQ